MSPLRKKPSAVITFAVSSGALPVAGHHLRPLDRDLARRSHRHLAAVVVEQLELGVGHRQADVAAVGGAVDRVAGRRRRGLRQAVALDDRAAGLLEPELGGRALHRHAAADRDHQAAPVDAGEVGVVGHRVEERVHRREAVELLALQLLEHGRQVARIGDQDVGAAHAHRQHHVRVEAEDVIDRQRADGDDLLAVRDLLQRRLVPGLGLQDVGDEVAMQQHRALAHAGGAAGVLQHRDVVGADLGRLERLAAALRERVVEAHRAGQVERRHHLLHLAHDVVDDQRLRKAEHVAHRGEDDLLGRHRRHHLLQHAGEVLDDDDRLGARVLQLVLELARRVERVDVDDDEPGTQDRRHRDRVLRHVGHHHRDAVALGEALRLQPGGERARGLVDLAKVIALPMNL